MTRRKTFVLLPQRSLSSRRSERGASTTAFFHALEARRSAPAAAPTVPEIEIKVLDSIHEDGCKLVEMDEADVGRLRAAQPDVIVAPLLYYRPAVVRAPAVRGAASPLGAQPAALGPVRLRIVDAKTGAGVTGAQVVAFTDFAQRLGASGQSDAGGNVSLAFGASPVQIERLYVYPPLVGYWGLLRGNLQLHSGIVLQLEPVDLSLRDGVRHFLGAGRTTDGAGVTVGVVDTGVGPHPDIVVVGDVDNGEGHGTHVAGIISARGTPPQGLTGVAPGVTLRSYRVFSNPGGLAANFTIAKAIDQAVADGCDLVNLSLKIDREDDPSGFVVDPVVQFALEDARRAGVLPIAAAGNDGHTLVDFPGRDPNCIGVSALGREGCFPAGSLEEAEIVPPPGTDPHDFIAEFSNVGPEVDLTAPGVGILSTVPGGYGPMSGTSMACPAATGTAARLLSAQGTILSMPRDATRSQAMMQLVLGSAGTLGFPATHEGRGLAR